MPVAISTVERFCRAAAQLDVDDTDLDRARSFAVVDPDVKNPRPWYWDRAFALFGLLL